MKTASTQLVAFLASNAPFIGADLYAIKLYDGTLIFLTSLDRNVTYTGTNSANPDFGTNTYFSLGSTANKAIIQRSKVSMAVGLSPSKVDVEIFADKGVLVEGQQILSTIAQGKWTAATVFIRRAFILPTDLPVNFNTPIPCNLGGTGDGTLIWFSGQVGKISELSPQGCKFEVRDLLWYLNRGLPKNLFGPSCYHKLFDAGCTLNPAPYTQTGSVLTGSTATVVNTGSTDNYARTGPVSGPSLSNTGTKYQIPATTYYVIMTYVSGIGETIGSPEVSRFLSANQLLQVTVPAGPVTGAIGVNLYVGTSPGDEQLQNGSPLAFGAGTWTMPTSGIYLSGTRPPQVATNGYWALGVLSLTYAGGTLAGQTVSALIESNTSGGAVTLRSPLPQIPTTSDSFSIVPGCDKRMSTCNGKFSNLIHFAGYPFVPVPESAI